MEPWYIEGLVFPDESEIFDPNRKNTISQHLLDNLYGFINKDYIESGRIQVVFPKTNRHLKCKWFGPIIDPYKLLDLFNHLRERFDRLVDLADEETLNEILSSDHFLVRYPNE